jgi:uncharacterized membrane protein YcaP (DUF421 family)
VLIHWLGVVFSHPDPATSAAIAVKTLVIYTLVVLGMRLIGTRQLGQLTTYDFVLIVVLSNSVQNALVEGDSTLFGGLISAATLLLANAAFTWLLNRIPWLEQRLVGVPVLLVSDGEVHEDRMRREGVQRDELMAALRDHGIASLGDVHLAMLEVDGTISVVPRGRQAQRPRHRIRGLKV